MRTFPLSTIVAVCVLCLMAVSCRKSENASNQRERSEPAQSSVASAVPVDNRPVVVAFGDSLTAGVAGRSYPEHLQELLDAAGLKYRVENQGVSGDTTTDGLARIENVIAAHPRLVLLEFGGNDGLRGVPVRATKKNLGEMIQRLRKESIPVVLLGITLPPNYGPDYVKPFTEMFSELAKEYKLPLMPFLLVNVYQHSGLMQPDGIHPNGDGNKIVARDVLALVKPMLAGLKKQ